LVGGAHPGTKDENTWSLKVNQNLPEKLSIVYRVPTSTRSLDEARRNPGS